MMQYSEENTKKNPERNMKKNPERNMKEDTEKNMKKSAGEKMEKRMADNETGCPETAEYMTEEEKIFAGLIFDPRKKELKDIKHKAHEACRRYNAMDEYDPDRLPIVKEFIGEIGKTYYFQGPIQFNYGSHTYIGENFFANFNLTVMDDARIYIGDNVCFGPNVSLMATNHPLIAEERMGINEDGSTTMAEYAEEIHIGNNVWLACNVTVIGGVTIGDNAVIGAGSVVTKDIPSGYLAYGNPAKPIRPITEKDSVYLTEKI